MSALPRINEGQSTPRPPMFNEKYYSWWKARMEDFLTVVDYELWTIVNQGPLFPTKQNAQSETIWDSIQNAHQGVNQVKRSRTELLMRNYELFSMKESQPIHDMMTLFTIIANELKSLGKVFTSEELVSKVLRIFPASWESKVTTIQEAKELDKISLDELVINFKTHEMRKIELRKEVPNKDKDLVLKAFEDDESDYDDPKLAMFAKFKRFMKNSKSAPKRETSSKHKQIDKANYDGCYKCGEVDHMVNDCPIWEIKRRK
ncbi:uncharacterized protein [Nicotiana tomentosiformis]|uniref:uncharacterized protein n=1 Tax=Nicotiana tomentosiformis TaxID=4098 RepID=UPI00388CB656